MTKRKPLNEVLVERILKRCEATTKHLNSETDPDKRLKLTYKFRREYFSGYILELSALTDGEFDRLYKEQTEAINQAIEKVGTEFVERKLAHGELNIQTIQQLTAEGAIYTALSHARVTKSEQKALSKRRNLARLLNLAWLTNWSLILGLGAIEFALEPLSYATDVVKRHFGADENWVTAAAILSVHENLIKRKLVTLGIDEEEVERISRDRGSGFRSLYDLLAKKIEEKEQRKVPLTFYRNYALRSARDRLEHQGYRQPVTHDEVLDLIRELRLFENVIFPPEKK